MHPVSGHFGSGLLSLRTEGASLGMQLNRIILSTEIILFSTLHAFQITQACRILIFIPYVTASPAKPEIRSAPFLVRQFHVSRVQASIKHQEQLNYHRMCLLRLVSEPDTVTKIIRTTKKPRFNRKFILTQSHSIVVELWKLMREKSSTRPRF